MIPYKDKAGCYYGAGQCFESIASMELSMPSRKKPSLMALYESIGQEGLAYNYQIAEAHNFFPDARLQIGLELPKHNPAGLKELGDGTLDGYIRQLAKRYKAIPLTIYLRVGYEFDGEWNNYEPDLYIGAFQRIVTIFRTEGVSNVEFVWNTYICDNKDIYRWYPGDDYVDWFSFNTVTAKFSCGWFMEQAKLHQKPVMIGEASYAIVDNDMSFQEWCQQFFEMIHNYDIRGFQYINWEWGVYPEIANWNTWKNGRYTDTDEGTAVMNRMINQYDFIMREKETFSPIRMMIDCARGMKETQEEKAWDKSLDHYACHEKDDYYTNNINCVYDGWKPFWKVIGEEGMVTLYNFSYKGDGFVYFKLSNKDEKEIAVHINEKKYIIKNQCDSMVKIPVQLMQDERIVIRFPNKTQIELIGIQAIEKDNFAPADLERNEEVIQWRPQTEAAGYNVYRNYQFYKFTDESHVQLADFNKGDILSITSYRTGAGESKPISYMC